MSEKTLKFNHVVIDKRKDYIFEQSIILNSVLINKIVTSHISEHSDKGFISVITKKTVLFDLFVLYCLKSVDT